MIDPGGFPRDPLRHSRRPSTMRSSSCTSTRTLAPSPSPRPRQGLLPTSQHALIVLPNLAYHDYEGIALDLDERERRWRRTWATRPRSCCGSHGTLAAGPDCGGLSDADLFLERACQMQVMAAAGGREHLRIAPQNAIETVKEQQQAMARGVGADARAARLPAQARPGVAGLRRVGVSDWGTGWSGGGVRLARANVRLRVASPLACRTCRRMECARGQAAAAARLLVARDPGALRTGLVGS